MGMFVGTKEREERGFVGARREKGKRGDAVWATKGELELLENETKENE